ncbi:DUF1553 domain-containing protein [Botrimarina hoheduenensis]|uniref:Planctomycete cytochrome C n=1 Tax=Botrimarina hoheduenensis TaxID=2528000 RepID=A0A5C5VSU4_9BACT|nr:DUF1553 domain-containing protein [Botrimarina hoheduenensis]TWT40659.1 Planctomycete cytochrome C [Botrimarina hoheduenensis]
MSFCPSSRSPRRATLALLAASTCLLVTMEGPEARADANPDAPDNRVRFGEEVRPILSDKCYFCHGPDEENRAADLRLDLSETAREAIDSGELLRRIQSDDEYEQMPPPEAKHALTEAEREVLEAWIAEGGEYEAHWAFEPLPEEIEPPVDPDDGWSRGPIDRFVRRKAVEVGFEPTEEAAPARWLRRVSFDLTGLPPTLDELDAFLADAAKPDQRERAYTDAVRRLIDSPAYGENLAIPWLDAARYADSYGYQSDKLNTQWPYRDWVIRAFNENLPYDQFLTWQLAGDLLASPTTDQRLATAFNRLHRLNNEGGAVFEEWRLENVADRVHTFGTAVLGLTLECCRCHDHKYDPIPAKDYYALSAFFNSIDENGVYDNSEKVPAPSLLLPTDEQAAELESLSRAVEAAEAAYQRSCDDAEQRFQAWKPSDATLHEVPDLERALSFDVPYDKTLKEEVYYPASGDRALAAPLATIEVQDSPLPRLAPERSADGRASSAEATAPRLAVGLDGERGVVMPGVEPPDRWKPFSIVLSLRDTKRTPTRSVIAQCSHGQLAFNGWDLTITDGYLESRMYRVWPGNAIGVRTKEPIPADAWHQVTATYDGSSKAAGLRLYLNGEELETRVLRDAIKKRAMVEVMHGGAVTIGQRFRDVGFDGGLVDDVRVYKRALTPAEATHLATGEPVEPTAAQYASAFDADARAALARLTEAREALIRAEELIQEVPIMEEAAEPREAHVLARGAYDAETGPDTLVERAVFSDFGPRFPADEPLDRLGLARWATDPEHPLTARVFVNRMWANFFGAGLVRTPENFGLQGELPTHPELLDWLARDFVEHGWDIKRLCEQIVLSATYRQDSKPSPELAEADPENRLLARGPAYRLDAEEIRDLALAVSGRMNRAIGGPPVSPYQPGDDLWKESNSMSPSYQQSVGVDLYRRSLYSVWKRTAPLPNMMAFDTQSREVCTVARPRTNTPLQALVLLNDPQFVEAARSLAEHSMRRGGDAGDQIAWAFRSLTGRAPDDRERAALIALLDAETAHYADDPDAAAGLLSIGESDAPAELDTNRLAAMTVVCQAVMNLDATVWKR